MPSNMAPGDAGGLMGESPSQAHPRFVRQDSVPWESLADAHVLPKNQFGHEKGLGRVALGAAAIGLLFGTHIMIMGMGIYFEHNIAALWGFYMAALMVYHYLEFIVTAYYHPNDVSFESFLLFHSKEYIAALLVAWVEFWLEAYFVPEMKASSWCVIVGVVLIVGGQFFRAAAMWTAGQNFSHIIVDERKHSHRLITTGVYRYLRHPSYFGWFYWALGTQVLLGNPICFVIYAVVTWKFFSVRIAYEEATLYHFFPEYSDYVARTAIGIPCISSRPPTSPR